MQYYQYCGSFNGRDSYDLYSEYIENSDGSCADVLQESTTIVDCWHVYRRVPFNWWSTLPSGLAAIRTVKGIEIYCADVHLFCNEPEFTFQYGACEPPLKKIKR